MKSSFWGFEKYGATTTTTAIVLGCICIALFVVACVGVCIYQHCRDSLCCCCRQQQQQQQQQHREQVEMKETPKAPIAGEEEEDDETPTNLPPPPPHSSPKSKQPLQGLGSFAARKNFMDLRLNIPSSEFKLENLFFYFNTPFIEYVN